LGQHRPLDAEVIGDDPTRTGAARVRLGTRHEPGEIGVVGARLVDRGLLQRGEIGGAEGAGHGTGVTEVAGEPTGVDAGDAGDAVTAQEGIEVLVAAPVAAATGHLPHHDAPAEGAGALVVGGCDPVVADVRVGERDDLPGVGRVGDDLLVAGQHRVEDDLAGRNPAGAEIGADGFALERRAVRQHQQRLGDGSAHRWTSESTTTASPKTMV
jgi:hypothetical protein